MKRKRSSDIGAKNKLLISGLVPNEKFMILAARLKTEYDVNAEVLTIVDRMEAIRTRIGSDDITLAEANSLHDEVGTLQSRISVLTSQLIGVEFKEFASRLSSNFHDMITGKTEHFLVPLCDGEIRSDVRTFIANDSMEKDGIALVLPALRELSALSVYGGILRKHDPSQAVLLEVDLADEWVQFAQALLRSLSSPSGVHVNKANGKIDYYPGGPAMGTLVELRQSLNVPSLALLETNIEWLAEATNCNVFMRSPKALAGLLTLFSTGTVINKELSSITDSSFDCSQPFDSLAMISGFEALRLGCVQQTIGQLISGEHVDENGVSVVWQSGAAFEETLQALLNAEIASGKLAASDIPSLASYISALCRNTVKLAFHALGNNSVTSEQILLGVIL